MPMQNNLRISTSNNEFAKELNNTIINKEEFLIWHSLEDHRILAKATVESVKFDKKQDLIASFKYDNELKDQKVYFLYNEKSEILFKAELVELTKDIIRLKVSDKKYLKEKRGSKRIEFNNIAVNIVIKTIENDKKKTKRLHEVTISDISERGVSFLIPRSQSLLFKVDSPVTLSKIEKIQLPKEIPGKIIHTTEMAQNIDTAGNARLMIGVKFDSASKLLGVVIDEVKKSSE